MARKAILIDINRCNGCYNCFLACRDEHYGNDYPPLSAAQPLNGQFWMQIKEIERGKFPRPKLSYIPTPCMHCKDAPCIHAAKDGAVYKREDGVVVIDPEKAKGQKDIVNACPYRAIFWNEEKEIPQKCTFCAHRLDEGEKQPRCVESCPTGAMYYGDIEDPDSEISLRAKELKVGPYKPEFNLDTAVLYAGIPGKFVAGEVVLADDTGECANGVKVVLKGEGQTREILSDDYGDFEFEGLDKNKTYTLTVEKEGYRPFSTEFFTRTDVNLGEIVLDPA